MSLETVRLFLHILGASVWVGGQIVLGAMVSVLREAGGDAARRAAQRFAQVAWPFFGLAVLTGMWNVMADSPGDHSTGYQVALMVKLLLVAATGVGAAVHGKATKPTVRGMTAGFGLLAGLAAMFVGVGLALSPAS